MNTLTDVLTHSLGGVEKGSRSTIHLHAQPASDFHGRMASPSKEVSRRDPISHKEGCPIKKFAFVNEAAQREYKDLPEWVQDEFGKDLRRIQYGQEPELSFKHLTASVGTGAVELIINGSPAFRCVYIAKYADAVIVLHSFVKTTNGTDRQAMKVAEDRLTDLRIDLRKQGIQC
ncbi:type II toxin-antitoxin system RelE/ParE family toxin [Pseudomonas fluorescens]|uniref:type II toxin-antitoxin system RelE/ParE family toxin n=1 Tax=Pseudomonas fluorescens TaxID=294 RepID=UPI001F220D4B|nr:type II toxin-antitoxin system RelE/ParE family toxin [Pseudomonas fluorescens]